jgi:GntR family transcriptional regulator/MocR family aminotransferase
MLSSSANSPIARELLIPLERGRATAMHEQLEAAIRDGIRAGRLPADASLPPSRTLAAELGVSRGVVMEAYSQLVARAT